MILLKRLLEQGKQSREDEDGNADRREDRARTAWKI
jgi:hypothetical protein